MGSLRETLCSTWNDHLKLVSALILFLQGRLGPGRLHHCMRLIGAAERGMQMMVQRALERRAFGKLIAKHGAFLSDVAKVSFPPTLSLHSIRRKQKLISLFFSVQFYSNVYMNGIYH